jgi:hypothetical protein
MTIRLRAGQAQYVSIRDHVNAHNMSAVTAKGERYAYRYLAVSGRLDINGDATN